MESPEPNKVITKAKAKCNQKQSTNQQGKLLKHTTRGVTGGETAVNTTEHDEETNRG